MPLSSLYKGKGAGFILRLSGVMVLLSLLLSFALVPQPAAASASSLVIMMSVNPDVTHNGETIEFSVTLWNMNIPNAHAVNVNLYFTPPDATGNFGATEYQLNLAGGGANRIHLNVNDSFTYTSLTPWTPPANLPPQNGDKLSHTLNLNPGVTQAWGKARFDGTYDTDNDTATGSQTVHVNVIAGNPPPNPAPAGDPPLDPPLDPPAITVGGIAEFPVDGSNSSSAPYAVIIGGAIAALAVIALGGWFARRRWLRRYS